MTIGTNNWEEETDARKAMLEKLIKESKGKKRSMHQASRREDRQVD